MSLLLLSAIPYLPEFIFGIVMIVVPLLVAGVVIALWVRRKRGTSGARHSSPSAPI